jgi:hypothetical protein
MAATIPATSLDFMAYKWCDKPEAHVNLQQKLQQKDSEKY